MEHAIFLFFEKNTAVYALIKTSLDFQAKITRKIVLRLECTECKYRKQLAIKRCKHFELGGEKKRKVCNPLITHKFDFTICFLYEKIVGSFRFQIFFIEIFRFMYTYCSNKRGRILATLTKLLKIEIQCENF